MQLRPLPEVARVDGFVSDIDGFGPAGEQLCPCGSRRRAKSCHYAGQGAWVASAPDPLIEGPRTGSSHPKCYANSSKDCSSTISREHWISAGVIKSLKSLGTGLQASGFAWMNGEARESSVDSLASNILCERHNNALSPLDALAEKFITSIRSDELRFLQNDGARGALKTFTLVSGPLWELWMLKVLLGGMASKSFAQGGTLLTEWNDEVDPDQLTEVLFRGAQSATNTGMCILRHELDSSGRRHFNSAPLTIGVAALSSDRGGVAGVNIELGPAHLSYSAVPPETPLLATIGGIAVERHEDSTETLIAFAWPIPNNSVMRLSTAPPDEIPEV